MQVNWEKASKELQRKLDVAHVKSRKQGRGQVQYIEGWHAIAEANRIFGEGAWDRETVEMIQLGDPRQPENGGTVRVEYRAKVRITIRGDHGETIREGWGFGQGIDRDVGQAHESAVKEAETDAMKRALMTFGNPFGLALYDKERGNVGDPNEPTAEERLAAIKERALAAITAADSIETLNATWGKIAGHSKEIAADQEVIRAKDERKAALHKEAIGGNEPPF